MDSKSGTVKTPLLAIWTGARCRGYDQRMRRLLVASLAVLVASSSFAAPSKKKSKKDKGSGSGSGSAGGEIEMDNPATPTPPPATPEPAAEVSATPAPPPAADLPLAIDDRPLTLPKGKIDVHGGPPILVLPFVDNAGNKTSSTFVNLTVGATYGVDDKTEVGADYTFSLSPGDIKGLFAIHGAYRVLKDAKMELAIAAALEIQPVDTVNVMGMTSTNFDFALELGAWFRYHVAPKISVFTGLPALPHSGASLSRQGIPLPPVAYQLGIGLNDSGPIALGLPIGVGYQAAPNIYAFAATNLASIKIANIPNQFLFKDFIPFTIGGFYSMPKPGIDLGAELADDLKQPGDYLQFFLIGRYFVK